MTFDGKAFGAEIVGVVKGYLAKELAPLAARLEAVEKRIDTLPVPVDLSSEVAALKAAVEAIDIPELPDIGGMVSAAVSKAVADVPAPQDGKSVTVDDVAPLIASEVEKRVRDLPPAKDGRDGIDGKDGEPGKDGVGIAGAFIGRSGELVVTLSDGETRDLGPVVGKDGDPGKPGRDGFKLEDFDASVMDDGRTVLLSFGAGDTSYKIELGFPVMLYRGVHKDGQSYERGDTVTWGGSLWHCDQKTADKPGDGSECWTLCAKKGRDGKNGEVKQVLPAQPIRVGTPVKGE